jgi:TRAP-type C4-dicarboxylate transport system substrate-binding protein
MFVMNQAAFDRLDDDIKAFIDGSIGIEMARAFGQVADVYDKLARDEAIAMGNSVVTLDDAESQRWKEAVQPTIEQWYADSEALGIDGRALHASAQALVAEESAG